MLVRRTVFEEIGGFDERFFMYAEEADWQRRMRDKGWETVFLPSAYVTHLGGASGAAEKAVINKHFFNSLDMYQRKHHGIVGLISLRCAMAIGCLGVWRKTHHGDKSLFSAPGRRFFLSFSPPVVAGAILRGRG